MNIINYFADKGQWVNDKGKVINPASLDVVDVQLCDKGWRESLNKLGFDTKDTPAGPMLKKKG